MPGGTTGAGGQGRCTVAFLHDRSGREWLLKLYLVEHGDRVLALQSGTRTRHRARYEPLLDAIAASVTLRER